MALSHSLLYWGSSRESQLLTSPLPFSDCRMLPCVSTDEAGHPMLLVTGGVVEQHGTVVEQSRLPDAPEQDFREPLTVSPSKKSL